MFKIETNINPSNGHSRHKLLCYSHSPKLPNCDKYFGVFISISVLNLYIFIITLKNLVNKMLKPVIFR